MSGRGADFEEVQLTYSPDYAFWRNVLKEDNTNAQGSDSTGDRAFSMPENGDDTMWSQSAGDDYSGMTEDEIAGLYESTLQEAAEFLQSLGLSASPKWTSGKMVIDRPRAIDNRPYILRRGVLDKLGR